MDDEPAVAVEEAAEVEERPGDVDVRDIDVPVFVRPQGCSKPFPLSEGLQLCAFINPASRSTR